MELYCIGGIIKPDYYIIIETVDMSIPEYEEFSPGPDKDDPFPEFYETSVNIFKVDVDNKTVIEIGAKEMREAYKNLNGRKERIAFWRVLKYMEYKKAQ